MNRNSAGDHSSARSVMFHHYGTNRRLTVHSALYIQCGKPKSKLLDPT